MSERRPLIEGLKPPPQAPAIDPKREHEFVHGTQTPATAPPGTTSPTRRLPISTRIRADYAEALKRASLQRQLNKVEPNTLQDILEQAIEPWLKENGRDHDHAASAAVSSTRAETKREIKPSMPVKPGNAKVETPEVMPS
jgi:hypothetical protein